MKEWKAGGKQHKNPFLLKSIYNGWNREKSSAFIQHRNKHIRTGQFSFTHCKFDTFLKSQWERSEVENVMVHAPYHLAYMVECAFVKVPWSSIIQGGWFSVSAGVRLRRIQSLQICWSSFTSLRGWTTLTGGIRAQSTRSHFAPSPCVIKSLSALPSVGVSASCRHAVSRFKPVMTLLRAGLTPVVTRSPAVYPLTPLKSKISLCSVSFGRNKCFLLVVEVVGLHCSYGLTEAK